MKEKIFIGLAIIFLFISTFTITAFSEKKTYPKTLIISFPGASKGTYVTTLLADGYKENLAPFLLKMEFSTDSPSLAEIESAEKIISEMDNIILSAELRYPMQMINPYEEIAQENYEPGLLKLMNGAANKVAGIINNFHERYPDASIIGAAAGTGCDVLIQTLKEAGSKIYSIVFYFPTLATVKDTEFVDTLKRNGYTQDTVTVYAWVSDPTVPYLEELVKDNAGLFRFGAIEEAK